MMRTIAILSVVSLLGLQQTSVSGQDSKATLQKEFELLTKENELLKRENELLKQEIAALKKGESKKQSDVEPPPSVTVDNVEYVYQGMERSGANLMVTLLATSKKGDQLGPNGQMILIDDEGDKYTGIPHKGFSVRPQLREGISVKLVWRFGPNAISGQSNAPSAKITRFNSMSIEPTVGGGANTIDFRDVPTVVVKKPK